MQSPIRRRDRIERIENEISRLGELASELLDQQLERLAPLEGEWERLRSAFGSIEAAVAAPALEQVECQWRGALEIPEFPVRENSGYDKPFPHRALLF